MSCCWGIIAAQRVKDGDGGLARSTRNERKVVIAISLAGIYVAINFDMCLVHSNKLRVHSNASQDSHRMVMHQAASEVLTSCKA